MSSNEESSLLTPKQVPPMQPFIAMQQVVESKQEEEIPSPPPFFRVCGHFTALNPSRPMVFAKLMEQQFTNTDIQSNSNTNDLTKEEASMLEIPDLVGDVDINKSPTSLVNIRMQGEDWPSSLEGMQALSIDLSNRNEPNYATCSQTTLTAKNHPVESLLSLSSVRMIPTPQGLALLLKQSNAATAVNHSQGLVNTTRTTVNAPPRRHARWTSDEDELLRVAVDTEEGPPHNWKRISQKYFQGSRNAMACKGRWNKVSIVFRKDLFYLVIQNFHHAACLTAIDGLSMNRIYSRVWYTTNGPRKKTRLSCGATKMGFHGRRLPTNSSDARPNKFGIAFSMISILRSTASPLPRWRNARSPSCKHSMATSGPRSQVKCRDDRKKWSRIVGLMPK